jgi:hypothetical protein
MTYTKTWGEPTDRIKALRTSIRTIKEKITTDYNIPPTYIENLQTIEKSLNNIIAEWFGSVITTQEVIPTTTEGIQEE